MNNATRQRSAEFTHAQYRVDLDHHGDWCVWQRLAHNGWTVIESCDSHNGAVNLAARLNAEAPILPSVTTADETLPSRSL